MPIILTAPHGGEEWIPGVPKRTGAGVETVQDGYTYELTIMLADEIFRLTGRKPYVVAAQFIRKNIDANRPAHKAYDHQKAKKYYDTYHNKVAEYVNEVKQRWGHGLLLDIHAHGAEGKRDTIFRGTDEGRTLQSLVNRFGQEALTGPKSILGQLVSQGYKAFPSRAGQAEDSCYSGGYTVRHYGSSKGGIDALQLELGALHRYDEPEEFSEDLAQAIKNFAETYLPKSPSSCPVTPPPYSPVAPTTNGRRIAVLAYGKLINNKSKIREDKFSRAEVGLPIRMSRLSFAGTEDRKFSLTIDPLASPGKVYYATSVITSLPKARADLADYAGFQSGDTIAYV